MNLMLVILPKKYLGNTSICSSCACFYWFYCHYALLYFILLSHYCYSYSSYYYQFKSILLPVNISLTNTGTLWLVLASQGVQLVKARCVSGVPHPSLGAAISMIFHPSEQTQDAGTMLERHCTSRLCLAEMPCTVHFFYWTNITMRLPMLSVTLLWGYQLLPMPSVMFQAHFVWSLPISATPAVHVCIQPCCPSCSLQPVVW